jgi:hypothetical protein
MLLRPVRWVAYGLVPGQKENLFKVFSIVATIKNINQNQNPFFKNLTGFPENLI